MIFFGVELVQNRLSLVRESNASDFSQIELIRNKNSEVVIYLKIVQCSTTMYVFLAYVHNVPLECTTLFEGVPTFNFFLLWVELTRTPMNSWASSFQSCWRLAPWSPSLGFFLPSWVQWKTNGIRSRPFEGLYWGAFLENDHYAQHFFWSYSNLRFLQ